MVIFNARSLGNKTYGLCEFLKDTHCDICFVTEAWLKLKHTSTVAEIRDMGFDIKFQPRRGSRKGGGCAVIFKPALNVDKCATSSYKTFEVLQIIVKGYDYNLLRISTIYRTDHLSKKRRELFFDELDQYLESTVGLKGEHIMCGDFNIHVEDPTNLNTIGLYSITESYGYSQLVHGVTQREGGTLDLLFLKADGRLITLAEQSIYIHDICFSMTSDHHFIECLLPFVRSPPKPTRSVRSYRNYKAINIEQFCSDIENNLNIKSCNYFSLSVDDAVQMFEDALQSTLDKHAPCTEKCFANKRIDFTTPAVLENRRQRRRYERLYRKYKQPADYNKYKYYEKEVHKSVKSARNVFYCDQFDQADGDTRKTFQLLGRVLGKSKKAVLPDYLSDEMLCKDFENFFVNKVDIIRHNITPDSFKLAPEDLLPTNVIHTTPFNDFKKLALSDLNNVINDMTNKYCELDIIPTEYFKLCSSTLLPYLLYTVNLSLSSGTFPKSFKKTLVKPVLKNSSLEQNNIPNYRPVSNLCFLSKVVEKCVLKQLVQHLEENDMFCKFQSAYRQFHSCETAIAKISNDILNNLDSNDSSFLILLDLSSAFDLVDHSVLIKRLKDDFNIGGTVLKWFKSYLCERSFRVKINISLSNGVIVLYGVPQGSILGPILFLLYISEIEKIALIHGFMIHMFADDMQLYISFQRLNLIHTVSSIELCLRDIKFWMSMNFLKVNEDKTKLMLFLPKTHYRSIFTDLCISFGGNLIFPSQVATNLGVTLDSTMSMSCHINAVTSKGYYYIDNFYRVADKLTHELKVKLVTSYVIPLIDYCNVTLTCANNSYRYKLQKLLNSAVRFIFNLRGRRKRISITPYLKKLHFLPVEYRIIYKFCLLVYKCLYGIAPQYLTDLLTPKITYSSLRSSSDLLSLSLNVPKSTYGAQAFAYFAPYHWNKLPLGIRLSTSVDIFKKSLKTYLFIQCYERDNTT